MSADRLKVAYHPAMEQLRNPISLDFDNYLSNRNKFIADNSCQNSAVGGNDKRRCNIDENPVIVYQFSDLLQQPTKTRLGKLIRAPARYVKK